MINKAVESQKLYYNNFNLSHNHDTSGRIGKLIPVHCLPVVAGDYFDESVEFNIRFAPMSAPVMARFNVHFHSFYVPYRILTPRSGQESTWEKFVLSVGKPSEEVPILPHITGVTTGTALVDHGNYAHAYDYEFKAGSLWDYLKLPVLPNLEGTDQEVMTLPSPGIILFNHLAYQNIWNNWYRRAQIEEEMVFPLDLGRVDVNYYPDSTYTQPELPENMPEGWYFQFNRFMHDLFKLRTRNYERDYFTAGLPEPQFGDDVMLSGGQLTAAQGANISLSSALARFAFNAPQAVNNMTTHPLYMHRDDELSFGNTVLSTSNSGSPLQQYVTDTMDLSANFNIDSVAGLYATPFSVNELRLAIQLQGVREKINRGGTRYVEIMENVFGVKVDDLRIQRPQYLGGVKAPISIGAVLQTSESDTTPQGTMTGTGGTVGGNKLFRTYEVIQEAGVIMTIMSITPRTGYVGGIPREYSKFDPIDYYVPAFDRLGEQVTGTHELFYDLMNPTDNDGFAYNPRYQEYKSAYSTATGEFRKTLDNWHIYRKFSGAPSLSPDFIHAEPEDFDRIFEFENIENTSNEHFYAQLYFKVHGKRPMSKLSTPVVLF